MEQPMDLKATRDFLRNRWNVAVQLQAELDAQKQAELDAKKQAELSAKQQAEVEAKLALISERMSAREKSLQALKARLPDALEAQAAKRAAARRSGRKIRQWTRFTSRAVAAANRVAVMQIRRWEEMVWQAMNAAPAGTIKAMRKQWRHWRFFYRKITTFLRLKANVEKKFGRVNGVPNVTIGLSEYGVIRVMYIVSVSFEQGTKVYLEVKNSLMDAIEAFESGAMHGTWKRFEANLAIQNAEEVAKAFCKEEDSFAATLAAFCEEEDPFAVPCMGCGLKVREFKVCSGCHVARYCSRACQRHHWKTHERRCKALVALAKKKEALEMKK